MGNLRIALAQQPARAADLDTNRDLLIEQIAKAAAMVAEILVTAATPITGDAADLLDEAEFASASNAAIGEAISTGHGTTLRSVRGPRDRDLTTPEDYRDYRSLNGSKVGFFTVTSEEEMREVVRYNFLGGPDVIAISAALPYRLGGPEQIRDLLTELARASKSTVVFVNRVGGADRAVYYGGSLVISPAGQVLFQAPLFEPVTDTIELDTETLIVGDIAAWSPVEEQVWTALVVGTRDYIRDNGFSDVVIGLSGGIDSAVVAAITVDALGPENVHGIGMPGPYSSEGSVTDARDLATNLGIRFDIASIKNTYEAEVAALGDLLDGPGAQVAKENIQARLRALHLFTVANARNGLVLNTCNKSEDAVGYATIGGDSMGAYAPLADVPKTLVYRLAEWRNTVSPVIPADSITKPPSAELSPGQQDTDSLPPYDILDAIIDRYLTLGESATKIAAFLVEEFGQDRDAALAAARWVLTMIDRNEWKRQQGPLGPQVTSNPFAARTVPVTNRRRHN